MLRHYANTHMAVKISIPSGSSSYMIPSSVWCSMGSPDESLRVGYLNVDKMPEYY